MAITASAYKQDQLAITQAGCDQVIQKPFNAEKLLSLIGQYLHLQYDYAVAPHEQPTPWSKQNLQALSPEIKKELAAIAATLDFEGTINFAEEFSQKFPNEAALVNELTQNFRYDRIIELCR